MTFISAIANDKCVSVMSDGQLTGDEGEILAENAVKVHLYDGGRFFAAFAGSKTLADNLAHQIPSLIELGMDIKEIAFDIQGALIRDVPRKDSGLKIQMLVGGRNNVNEIVMYTTSNAFTSTAEIDDFKPRNNVNTVYLHSTVNGFSYSYNETNAIFAGYLKNREAMIGNELVPDRVKLAQEDLNSFVEKLDTTVNKVTNCYLINIV